jgi:hypothetical protein
VRSGNEPMTARSPLRLRLALAAFGLAAATAAAIVLGIRGDVVWTGLFAAVAAVACLNVIVVVIRIRQGARFQPGRDVPPPQPEPRPAGPGEQPPPQPGPRPADSGEQPPTREARQLTLATRRRVYLSLMGACLLLVILAWTLVDRYSTAAAVAMSVVALLVPPFAVIIANAGGDASAR